jgi:murein DD-endopeptidase MepM/ murein hydrolase activator NlpD
MNSRLLRSKVLPKGLSQMANALKNSTRTLLRYTSLFSYLLLLPIAHAEIKLSEQFFQGALIVGKTAPQNTVTLNKKNIKVSANGDYVLGFSRDEKNNSELVITTPQGDVERQILKPLKRDYNIQRIEGIAKKIMNPNPKAISRVKSDNQKIGAARSIDSDLTAFSQGFIAPIAGTITGVYGSQRYYNGVPKTPHYGLDYAGKTGDPVKSPADGVVLMYVQDMFYSGGTMIIDHGHGVSSTFLHLSDSYVKVGDKISKGQLVAAVGSSGRATGPHLDWRINWFNVRLDPALVLKLKPL